MLCIIAAADWECDFRNGNIRRRPMVSQNIYFHILKYTYILYILKHYIPLVHIQLNGKIINYVCRGRIINDRKR